MLSYLFDQVGRATTSDELKAHFECFQSLVAVINLVRSASRSRVGPVVLRSAVEKYLKEFKAVYGSVAMVPKFHSTLHFPTFVERHVVLPNCFVLERKHKQPKRFANEIRNTSGNWEATLARDVTNRHISTLAGRPPMGTVQLLDPIREPTEALAVSLTVALGAGEYRTSRSARINDWERVGTGDVVMLAVAGVHVVGQIALLADRLDADGRVPFCQVEQFEFSAAAGQHGSKYVRTGKHSIQLVQDIMCALVWSGSGRIVTALYPAHLQPNV